MTACRLIAGIAWLAVLTHGAGARAGVLWEGRPYRVEVALHLGEADFSEAARERVRSQLLDKLRNRLGRFWRPEFVEPSGPVSEEKPPEAANPSSLPDKRIACWVERLGHSAWRVRARELDVALNHTGAEVTLPVWATDGLGERLYLAVTSAFRPVARFRRDPQSPGRVTLSYLASELAPPSGFGVAAEDELLLPFTRRLKRGGDPAPGDAAPVKWTYLVAEAPGEETGARVVSHSKRSLAGRAGGRVERLALVTPADRGKKTTLRLHALSEPETPLPGYEVLLGSAQRDQSRSLGFSDKGGRVAVPNEERVAFAHIRCGGLFVASLPVAPGVDEIVEIPLVDERSRLRAELEVTNLRERLVDTAARRRILSERIKRAIATPRIELAVRLLEELDTLPGRTQFSRELDQIQRQSPTTHPAAKKRLDKLFDKTRLLVTSALDPRDLREISQAVSQARSGGEAASAEEGTPSG